MVPNDNSRVAASGSAAQEPGRASKRAVVVNPQRPPWCIETELWTVAFAKAIRPDIETAYIKWSEYIQMHAQMQRQVMILERRIARGLQLVSGGRFRTPSEIPSTLKASVDQCMAELRTKYMQDVADIVLRTMKMDMMRVTRAKLDMRAELDEKLKKIAHTLRDPILGIITESMATKILAERTIDTDEWLHMTSVRAISMIERER